MPAGRRTRRKGGNPSFYVSFEADITQVIFQLRASERNLLRSCGQTNADPGEAFSGDLGNAAIGGNSGTSDVNGNSQNKPSGNAMWEPRHYNNVRTSNWYNGTGKRAEDSSGATDGVEFMNQFVIEFKS